MIMSLHDPLSRKRNLGQEPLTDPKRARTENEQEKISEQVYTLFVKSAMESLEKVCEILSRGHQRPEKRDELPSFFVYFGYSSNY